MQRIGVFIIGLLLGISGIAQPPMVGNTRTFISVDGEDTIQLSFIEFGDTTYIFSDKLVYFPALMLSDSSKEAISNIIGDTANVLRTELTITSIDSSTYADTSVYSYYADSSDFSDSSGYAFTGAWLNYYTFSNGLTESSGAVTMGGSFADGTNIISSGSNAGLYLNEDSLIFGFSPSGYFKFVTDGNGGLLKFYSYDDGTFTSALAYFTDEGFRYGADYSSRWTTDRYIPDIRGVRGFINDSLTPSRVKFYASGTDSSVTLTMSQNVYTQITGVLTQYRNYGGFTFQGDSIQIPSSYPGWYIIDPRISYSGSNLDYYEFAIYVDDVIVQNRGKFHRSHSSNDVGVATTLLNYNFSGGEWVKFMIMNDQNNNDATIIDFTVYIKYDE